jgi:hypothetical protein
MVARIYVSEASSNDVNDRRKEKVQYRYKVSMRCGSKSDKACTWFGVCLLYFIVCVLIVLYCPSVSYLTKFNVVRGWLDVRVYSRS